MEKEKLILRKRRYRENDNYLRVRVTADAKDRVDEMCKKTNMSEKELVSTLLIWAIERTEVKNNDED